MNLCDPDLGAIPGPTRVGDLQPAWATWAYFSN